MKAVRECLPATAAPELREKLMRITSQSVQGCATLEELRGFMEGILGALQGESAAAHTYSQLVQEGMAYLQKNYDRNLSLEEICGVLGVSRNYFCYLFKKETGQNLWACLTDIRLAKAKELLCATEDKSYAIAYQVGYDNPSYFSKLFKRSTGMTPNEYRKAGVTE